MYRYALVYDFKVVGVVKWDGKSKCSAFDGYIMVRSDKADVGDFYDPVTKSIYNPDTLLKRVGEYQLGD